MVLRRCRNFGRAKGIVVRRAIMLKANSRLASTQRYLKDKLSAERKRRLDKLGFVWNWRDYLWERGFANILKFKRREGHCRVPSVRKEENHNLGYWVSTQRKNQKEMSAERKARLNKIKFAWKVKPGRFAYQD
jgi:Helicase associated domain